ncbi:MAG: hypothetical protein P4L71_05025, partial [Acetobacteraceae bacterium]|nr:hypothetical protein [Acetobacteraceae bacterium]
MLHYNISLPQATPAPDPAERLSRGQRPGGRTGRVPLLASLAAHAAVLASCLALLRTAAVSEPPSPPAVAMVFTTAAPGPTAPARADAEP